MILDVALRKDVPGFATEFAEMLWLPITKRLDTESCECVTSVYYKSSNRRTFCWRNQRNTVRWSPAASNILQRFTYGWKRKGTGNEISMLWPDTGDECRESTIECEQSMRPNTILSTAMCLSVGSKLKIPCGKRQPRPTSGSESVLRSTTAQPEAWSCHAKGIICIWPQKQNTRVTTVQRSPMAWQSSYHCFTSKFAKCNKM